MKRVVVVFLVLATGLGVALYLKLRDQEREASRPPGSSGVVEGTRVTVSARLAARVTRMAAQEGDRVEAGDVLAELDCAEPDAAVAEGEARVEAARVQVAIARAQAEAAMFQARAAARQADGLRLQAAAVEVQGANAKRQSDRVVRLASDGVAAETSRENAETAARDLERRFRAAAAGADASLLQARAADRQARAAPDQVRAAEALLAAGEAALARARALKAECRVVAPRGGTVTLRAREPGEVVLPGSTLYEITDLSEPRVTFYVANADLGRVAPGDPVEAVADARPGMTFSGVVRRVAAEAEFTPRTVQTRSDRERLVYEVEATLSDPQHLLRAGMPVEVTVTAGGR